MSHVLNMVQNHGFINYVKGSNIAGFMKVANAMLDQDVF